MGKTFDGNTVNLLKKKSQYLLCESAVCAQYFLRLHRTHMLKKTETENGSGKNYYKY